MTTFTLRYVNASYEQEKLIQTLWRLSFLFGAYTPRGVYATATVRLVRASRKARFSQHYQQTKRVN